MTWPTLAGLENIDLMLGKIIGLYPRNSVANSFFLCHFTINVYKGVGGGDQGEEKNHFIQKSSRIQLQYVDEAAPPTNFVVDRDCKYRLPFRLHVRVERKDIRSCLERWPRGLKRRIANPLYKFYVPRVRIPLSPLLINQLK